MWFCVLTLCFVVTCSAAAQADELTAQAAVSSQRPCLGDPVVLQISVSTSTDKMPDVDTTTLESIEAKAIGQPATGQSISIINGVRSEKYTFQFQFQFTPTKAGRITLPGVTIRQGGQKATTRPIEIEVIGPEDQDWAIVDIVPSDRAVYPGQTITLSVQILLRRLEHQGELLEANPFSSQRPPHVTIPWLDSTELIEASPALDEKLQRRARDDGPGFPINDLFRRANMFSFFDERVTQAAVRFDRDEVERPGKDGEKRAYYRYTLPLEFRAVRAGAVGPLIVQLRGPVYTGVRRGPRGLEAEHTDLFAVSKSLSLSITAVPKAGQPDTFTGGIGNFTATATAAPTKVRVGDPITLAVRVTGTGTLDELGPPNLAAQPKWSDDFKIHDDASPSRDEDGAKVFTFSVRPRRADVAALPPVRLSYFNPKSKRYEDTFTERIPLEVSDTARLDVAEIVDKAPQKNSPRALEELAGGLAANYTGPDVLDPDEPFRLSAATLTALAVAPPLAWLAAFLAHRRAVRRRQNPAWVRAQGAHRRAAERLDAVAKIRAEDQADEVARVIANYIADRLNLPAGEVTPAEVRQRVAELGADRELTDECAELIDRCDRVRFAQTVDSGDVAELVDAARALLDRVERVASRNGRRPRALAGVARSAIVAVVAIVHPAIGDRAVAAPIDRHAVLARANAAFERGARAADDSSAEQSFREAITAYEELVRDGVENGKLYYNLANAHFRAGDVPRAILHYRVAERLRPRDSQIAANLAYARSRVAERIEPTETSRLMRQFLFAHYSWSLRERSRAAVASLLFGWLLLGSRIVMPRRWLTVVGIIGLAAAGALAVSVGVQMCDESEHPLGVLVSGDVTVRTGDGETYEPQFNRPLGPGTEFRLLERRSDWIRIELPDGKRGWVRASDAAIQERS